MKERVDVLLKSWIGVKKESDFPIQNLPFGIFRTAGGDARGATRIGDTVVDLRALARHGFLDGFEPELFNHSSLNPFIALGKPAWRAMHERLTGIFGEGNPTLSDQPEKQAEILFPVKDVEMLMPVQVGDYTDFYSSMEHATNVGIMFRDAANALLPNWKHLPVGYHGRSSSIVVSGTSIHRPKGQTKADNAEFVTQHILALKKDLARTVSFGPVTEKQQRKIERLAEQNGRLREENRRLSEDVEKWRAGAMGIQVLTNQPGATSLAVSVVKPVSPGQPPSRAPAASDTITNGPPPVMPATIMPATIKRTHTVKAGETAARIARRYGVKLEALRVANPRLDPRRLRPGQTLNIPAANF